jgi:hypothetical protein
MNRRVGAVSYFILSQSGRKVAKVVVGQGSPKGAQQRAAKPMTEAGPTTH